MQNDEKFIPGINTHETVILNCFGGMSNVGITAALASLEAVKELIVKAVMEDGGPEEES